MNDISANSWIAAPELRFANVWLDPIGEQHRAGLVDSVNDGELWTLWYTSVPRPEDVPAFIERAIRERDAGESFAFAVRLADSGQVVGSTRFMRLDAGNRRAEIGHTWYGKRVQRTAVNTACKYAMLRHAFDSRDAIAVEFRTHRFNRRSRAAIERLGAVQDGILRNHVILADGSIRDTAVYSVIASEWPVVKRNLEWLMQRGGTAPAS